MDADGILFVVLVEFEKLDNSPAFSIPLTSVWKNMAVRTKVHSLRINREHIELCIEVRFLRKCDKMFKKSCKH